MRLIFMYMYYIQVTKSIDSCAYIFANFSLNEENYSIYKEFIQ